MKKLDLSKKYKHYFSAKVQPGIAEFPEIAQYLSIKGIGDPSHVEFAEKVQALYAVSYVIKFICKGGANDFVVPKLEGLWSFDESKYSDVSIVDAPGKIPRKDWQYILLIRMPEFVKTSDIRAAKETAIKKKKIALAEYVEAYEMREGKVVQILHTGPFDKEPESLLKMDELIKKNNFRRNGLHHEIYLSDFRKTPPEKLKTILREPVK